MKLLSRRSSALALSLAVLGGCGVFAQPSAVSSKASLVTSKAASAQAGALEVSLLTAQAQRKLLAVVADIATYRVMLTGSNINGSLVKTAPAPSNGSNKVATRFENLVPGTYTMKVEALDAAGNVIGSSTQTGVVTAGKCTYIDLNIKLSDTLVTNSKGHLGARVTIEDGNVVERPIEDCPANDGFTAIDGPCVNVTPTPVPTATLEPTPAPTSTPTPMPGVYIGEDRMSMWGLGPDGIPDTHLHVQLNIAGPKVLKYVRLHNSQGHSSTLLGENVAFLGVWANDVLINNVYVSSLGEFNGDVVFDLYVTYGPAYYYPGAHFMAKFFFEDGTVEERSFTVPSNP